MCSVQAGLILPDPLRRYFDLFPTELVCGTDEHNDPLVGARVKSGRGLSWGNDIGTMATMAINNDIFRWGMVALPLLGGHHPTNQPLSQCHCRTTAAVVWHRDTPTVCNVPILRIISKWSNHPPTRICPVSKCHNRAQFYRTTTQHIMVVITKVGGAPCRNLKGWGLQSTTPLIHPYLGFPMDVSGNSSLGEISIDIVQIHTFLEIMEMW